MGETFFITFALKKKHIFLRLFQGKYRIKIVKKKVLYFLAYAKNIKRHSFESDAGEGKRVILPPCLPAEGGGGKNKPAGFLGGGLSGGRANTQHAGGGALRSASGMIMGQHGRRMVAAMTGASFQKRARTGLRLKRRA